MAARAMTTMSAALSDASPIPYWLDDPGRPAPEPGLTGDATCDLLVVGGGYSGLWTALLAKERDPGRDVLLLEGREVGWAASGRNGGFCAASLTHGTANGLSRWPDEMQLLEELGARNLDAIESAVHRYGIDCAFERTGEISVATRPHHVTELRELYEEMDAAGLAAGTELLDEDALRAQVNSPTFLGGLWDRDGVALVDPAKLAWGLKAVCLSLGVRIHENTPATSLTRSGAGMAVRTLRGGTVRCAQVALGTNVFPLPRPPHPPPHRAGLRLRADDRTAQRRTARRHRLAQPAGPGRQRQPVPLLPALLRQPHPLGRLRRGLSLRREGERRPGPAARDLRPAGRPLLRLLPAVGGECASPTPGAGRSTPAPASPRSSAPRTAGRVAYAAGYTGLGVGATRFGADVMLDLLSGEETERTALEMVRTKPLPFPPEPFAWTGVALTKWSLARADELGGHRNLWLRTMDRMGMGFDS